MNLTNTYAVVDVETTITPHMKRKASPFTDDNWIVAAGWKFNGGEVQGAYYGEDKDGYRGLMRMLLAGRPKLLGGFNIKFDLLHLLRDPDDYAAYQEWVAAGGLVWDGQLAEYLLTGMVQESHMLSLDEVAPRYGGDTKIDEVKALWEKGVNTHLIPRQLLMDYLVGRDGDLGDIENTERIMLGQLAAARELGMLNSIRLNMGALLASVEMERNGLWVNKALGLELAAKLETDIARMREELQQYLPKDLPFEFNWGSPKQKSALIFGGQVKYQAREAVLDEHGEQAYALKDEEHWVLKDGTTTSVPPGHGEGMPFPSPAAADYAVFTGGQKRGQYKTKKVKVPDKSKPKSRIADFWYTLPGFTKPRKEWEGAEPGVYSTSAAVIEELADSGIPFLETYGELSAKVKDLGTYYITPDEKKPGEFKGMLTLVGDDGIVHHGVNHTSTVTGRLSHSNPNMGNLPRGDTSEVKRMFGSRFDSPEFMAFLNAYLGTNLPLGGDMSSSDFKTLEIYCQAMLTGDAQLIADLKANLDMHCARLATVEGIPYEKSLLLSKGCRSCGPNGEAVDAIPEWESKRTDIKQFSFQRAYGAGAPKIARTIKRPVDDVEKWIAADEARYPGTVAWFEKEKRIVERSKVPTPTFVTHPTVKVRIQLHRGTYKTFDGKRYTFTESPAPDFLARRGELQSFSPTELKNCPVQGLGGEWMKAAMWLAVRAFYQYKNFGGLALLVNTVHDALYRDAHKSVSRKSSIVMHAAMLAASDLIEYLFGTPVPVPVPSDTTHGPSMYDEHGFEDPDAFDASAQTFRTWLRDNYMDGFTPSYLQ
jgi:DNA polymerase-1